MNVRIFRCPTEKISSVSVLRLVIILNSKVMICTWAIIDSWTSNMSADMVVSILKTLAKFYYLVLTFNGWEFMHRAASFGEDIISPYYISSVSKQCDWAQQLFLIAPYFYSSALWCSRCSYLNCDTATKHVFNQENRNAHGRHSCQQTVWSDYTMR